MLIYDLEIKKAIPPRRKEEKIKEIEYCDGWHDHEGMGISVICAMLLREGISRSFVFYEDNFSDFQSLMDYEVKQKGLLTGFNHINFDNKVLAAEGFSFPSDDQYYYDVLQEIWKANGLGTEFHMFSHAGYGLNAMAEINLGLTKSGTGEMAPVLWQKGQIGKLTNYCLKDVTLTAHLVRRIQQNKELINPRTGKTFRIELPSDRDV